MKIQISREIPRKQRAAIATHQAGHAVLAAHLGICFSRVTNEGLHRYDEWPLWAIPGSGSFMENPARRHVSREMSLAVAGYLAEFFYGPGPGFRWSVRNKNDWNYAAEIAWGFFGSPRRGPGREQEFEKRAAWVGRIADITSKILMTTPVERSLFAVGRELMEAHSVTGDQVWAICRKYATIPAHAVERYSPDESRWCRVEDARSIKHLGQDNTFNTTTCEEVLARLTVARTQRPQLVSKAAA